MLNLQTLCLLWVILQMFTFFGFSQSKEQPAADQLYVARIDAKCTDLHLSISGNFLNLAQDSIGVTYELSVLKIGRNGRSSSRQSGYVTAKQGAEVNLSTSTINILPNDFCKIKLQLFEASGQIIAQDSVIYPGKNSP